MSEKKLIRYKTEKPLKLCAIECLRYLLDDISKSEFTDRINNIHTTKRQCEKNNKQYERTLCVKNKIGNEEPFVIHINPDMKTQQLHLKSIIETLPKDVKITILTLPVYINEWHEFTHDTDRNITVMTYHELSRKPETITKYIKQIKTPHMLILDDVSDIKTNQTKKHNCIKKLINHKHTIKTIGLNSNALSKNPMDVFPLIQLTPYAHTIDDYRNIFMQYVYPRYKGVYVPKGDAGLHCISNIKLYEKISKRICIHI